MYYKVTQITDHQPLKNEKDDTLLIALIHTPKLN